MKGKPRKPLPRDPAQRAKALLDLATGETLPEPEPPPKNPHAQALGRLGGSKGGTARANKMTAEERSESARKAAKARWDKTN